MNPLLLAALIIAPTIPLLQAQEAKDTAIAADAKKPTVKLADDGYPTGDTSPEGAACDLARAFIKRDSALFKTVCLPAGFGGEEYATFIKETAAAVEAEAKKAEPSPGGPKNIAKVFAARHLSKNGPGSYGFAAHGFQAVMFVDVGCLLQNGGKFLNRTLVIQTKGGKWRVHPMPASSPLLSMGLNDETPSTKDFTEAYEIPKK